MARVLVVEDEAALSELVSYNLTEAGHDVVTCADGDEAVMMVRDEAPDIVILDWMLPNISGVEICRQLRARKPTRDLPIIMLTARAEPEDRVRGLETGADDYLTKPFAMSELLARVQAVLRRAHPAESTDLASQGDLTLDRANRRVQRAGRQINLGPTEYRLLDVLMRRPGRVYARSDLLDQAWGKDIYVEERTVDVHIGRLRAALNRRGERDPIRTVRGVGYALDETYTS